MEIIPKPEAREALIARAVNIIRQPKAEWPVIAAEPATIGSIYSSYVVYLAAIPVLATLIGSLVFGYGVGNFTFRPSIAAALTTAIVQYLLQLGGIYIFALIIDALAPRFGGEKNRLNAFKLAAYSATASWLAGIFGLIPMLGVLSLLGLYSLYLLYTGVPVLTKVAADKALGFTATVIAVGIVLAIVLGALGAIFLPTPTPGEAMRVGESVDLPGGVTLNIDRADEASKRMQQAAKQMEQAFAPKGGSSGQAAPSIDPAALKALLPAKLSGGLARGDVSASSSGAAGFTFGMAKADYGKGQARLTLTLGDMGPMGALASLGGMLGVKSSNETADTYSKVDQVEGRTTIEEFNRKTKSGKYATVVKNRIMIEAEGSGVTMDQLRAAVAAVDLSRLESLAGN